ncbi:hypothetical protein D9M68_295870 [compost metagenome]
MTIVGEIAEAELPVAETDKAGIGQKLEETVAESTVHDLVRLRTTVEEEGKVDGAELLDVVGEDAGVQHRHFDDAALQGRDGLDVATERAAREELHLNLAAALVLHEFDKLLHADHLRVTLVVGRCELDGLIADLGKRRSCRQQSERQSKAQGQFRQFQHVLLPDLAGSSAGRVEA